jgi:pullulanase/glycogen debranching enzyme
LCIAEGKPHPLGATWTGLGVNFALFSAHATRVDLCIYDERGENEIGRVELPDYTDEVWHGFLPDARPGQTLRFGHEYEFTSRPLLLFELRRTVGKSPV